MDNLAKFEEHTMGRDYAKHNLREKENSLTVKGEGHLIDRDHSKYDLGEKEWRPIVVSIKLVLSSHLSIRSNHVLVGGHSNLKLKKTSY